jgi:Spy/CpxP family protein refolding chaperone
MIHLRSFGALSLVLALAGLAGCNQPSGDDSADTDVATSELAAEPAPAKPNKGGKAHDKHHGGKHGGPGMLLGAALRELDLTDAQKSILQGQLDALRQDGEARPDHDAARAELAAAVKSGRVDESALLAKAAPAAPDTTRIAKAVGVLHDTLTAAQRKELVAAVEAKMERGGPDGEHERRGFKGDHERRGAKGERGEAKDGEGREGGKRGKHAGREMAGKGMEHGPMGHLLKDLSLSDGQREKVKEALSKLAPSEGDRDAMKAKHEAFRTQMKERLASFASDSFDANAFVALPEGGAKFGPDKMFGHMVKTLAVVVPILDDAQRAELAKRIEEGPGAKAR